MATDCLDQMIAHLGSRFGSEQDIVIHMMKFSPSYLCTANIDEMLDAVGKITLELDKVFFVEIILVSLNYLLSISNSNSLST